ncbi:MAG: aspartate aminotransferase family protein [Planctomycetota bacterium]|nr:MAG: aspartate aminotransferase family protein [Planctomycetota bacterium]
MQQDPPPIFPSPDPGARDALRAVLHQAADTVADYLTEVGNRPIFPLQAESPATEALPEFGQPLPEAFQQAAEWAIEQSIHVHHPGYAGHMDSGVAVAGIVADFLVSALNQNLLAYELAPGATLLEKKLLEEFRLLAGLPEGAGGTFTTGGTGANLAALLSARDAACRDSSRFGLTRGRHGVPPTAPLCLLASADAHYSIQKAAAILGLGSDRVLPVPVAGPERRLDPEALPKVLEQAVHRGLQPFALVATAGTTSCGAIDPIHACADFCEQHGLWLHVDGAHGGALLFHPQARNRLAGIHRADSLSLDPHKWLYAPKSAGLVLLRQVDDLVPAQYEAPYLDRFSDHGEALPVSQGRRALDGSRRFDAFKVWLILRHLGRRGLGKLLDDRLALTRWFHQRLSEHAFFLPKHIPDTNVQTFAPRASKEIPRIAEAHRALEATGRLWSSYTRLDGRPCHRVVLLNPAGEQHHLEGILATLEGAHRGLAEAGQTPASPFPPGNSSSNPDNPTIAKAAAGGYAKECEKPAKEALNDRGQGDEALLHSASEFRHRRRPET